MSRSSFHAHFCKAFGTTPAHYVRDRRLARARVLLREQPQAPLAAVAAATGFRSTSHFVQVFRRGTGTTPAAYRGGADA